MDEKIRFSVNIYCANDANERLTVSSDGTIWVSAAKAITPTEGEANSIEASIKKEAKKNGHISVRKHNGRPFDRELCNNVFEKAVQECKLHNDLYEEIKAKVYGLGINQMEFTIGSPEFEQLRKKFEDISGMCYQLDKNFANFETYTSHLDSLKKTLDTVKGAINDEDMEILKMTVYI